MKKTTPTLAEKVKEDFIEYDNKIYNQAIDDAIDLIKIVYCRHTGIDEFFHDLIDELYKLNRTDQPS